jgi:hypothetical protein
MEMPLNSPWVVPGGIDRVAFDRRLQRVSFHMAVPNQSRQRGKRDVVTIKVIESDFENFCCLL